MTARWFLRATLWLVAAILLSLARVSSADLIESRAYLEDPSGTLTFQEARARPFTPYTGVLAKGLTTSVYWLRLQINPNLAQDRSAIDQIGGFPPVLHNPSGAFDDLVMRVRPPYTDHISLYDPQYSDLTERRAGNKLAWRDSEFPSLNHAFVLPRGDGPRDVWLRVDTANTMLVGVDVLPYEQMRMLEKRQEILNVIDVSLILFFIVWAGLLFIVRRDRLVAAFLVVMVVSFFYATNYMGYYRIFLGHVVSAPTLDLAHSFLVILMPTVYLFFSRQLLKEYRPRPWVMQALLPLQYYFVIGWLLLVTGHVQTALFLNLVFALVGQIAVCCTLLFGVSPASVESEQAPPVSPRWALAYSMTITMLFTILMLPALGIVDGFSAGLYRNMIQGGVPFLFMAVLVHRRHRKLDYWQQRQVAKAEQMAASEKTRREDSEQFLAMLTHEIRTPLTVMAYATKTKLPDGELGEHVKSGIKEIDELIERCVQADRADQTHLPMATVETTVGHVVHDLKARFTSERIDWQLKVPSETRLQTDLALLMIVLNNLVDNAIKYSPDHASISVIIETQSADDVPGSVTEIRETAAASQDGLMVVVSNSLGLAGFPDSGRLFEKYYRAPRAHIRTGSGLGLYVARSFAINLGGQLTYLPTTDAVRFKLWLPHSVY